MRLRHLSCLALPVAVYLWASPLAPSARQQSPRAPAASGFAGLIEERVARKRAEIQGAWNLVRFEHVQNTIDQQNVRGTFLFTDRFLAMEIHARQLDPRVFAPEYADLHQSGIHFYDFDQDGRMRTATLRGSSSLDGELLFEEPNLPREYEVEVAGDSLVLLRSDGSRLVLDRVALEQYPEAALRKLEDARRPGPVGETR